MADWKKIESQIVKIIADGNEKMETSKTNLTDVFDELISGYGQGSSGLIGRELTQAEYDALSEEEKSNGLYFITDAEELEVPEMFPVGSCYTTSINENPCSWLGGTWELIDKQFISTSINDASGDNTLFTPTSYVTSYKVYTIRSGHSIRFRLDVTPNLTFSDTTCELGTINLNALGVNSLYNGLYQVVLQGDSANGSVMVNVNTSGLVSVVDVVKSNDSSKSMYLNEVIVFRKDDMLDEACNQFIWKRTE